ncbi:MAG: D-alanine--D-alanine ligase [Bacteroidales bacterium]|nr:D-alanine--D-alanine ligase [Bacteroidales bacterium]
MKYQNIAVIYGSDSSEWEVSCRSGEFTASRIDDSKYSIYEIFARFGKWYLVSFRKRGAMRIKFPEEARPEVNKNDFSVNIYGEHIKFDFAFIMQHGTPGENGLLQGYLEMLGVPFSSCRSFVAAVTFDKYSCKSYLRDVDFVRLAPDMLIRKGADVEAFTEAVGKKLGWPVFVKPTSGGSSFGVTKVHSAAKMPQALSCAFMEGAAVIVEKAIEGREFTCAAYYDGKDVKALPVIEIVTRNEYFDYDAKYNGSSEEICPAKIDDALASSIKDVTCKIYKHLGCAGVVRADYILGEDGLYFLEVNTIPGMTNASLVPKMVRAAGLDMTDFLTDLIESV